MPKNLYTLQYDGKYLGHVNATGQAKTCIFGFIKRTDALVTRQLIRYQPIETRKYASNCYILKTTPMVNPKKPINRKQLQITSHETLEVIVESLVHNVKIELIDEVERKNDDVMLYSNFNISIDVNDNSLMIETLNAMIENRLPDYRISLETDDLFDDEL